MEGHFVCPAEEKYFTASDLTSEYAFSIRWMYISENITKY